MPPPATSKLNQIPDVNCCFFSVSCQYSPVAKAQQASAAGPAIVVFKAGTAEHPHCCEQYWFTTRDSQLVERTKSAAHAPRVAMSWQERGRQRPEVAAGQVGGAAMGAQVQPLFSKAAVS